ncbi:hypothetical protein [Chitinophaga ginsengisegetis]|uniref:hypothetical protein n=1 Tax=Chitinophaga ginsengisegetis TaxID=393003 RepID=UPI000DB998F2|nr:hypothetical protein [Chitinophaga ginsengisegetis]MDR6568817.1 hypothetical protein [Chitinophaga ginsengisegetis]MDR6647952.1 hypothetical protein [Chitinophaga ginsengisegetis]MDR6654898.1 hypothetical protein [Chitinophaga ginsengisegetis]
MNRNIFHEQQEHKQSRNIERQIMDQYCVTQRNADKVDRDTKTIKMLTWASALAAIVGVVIALFK